MEKKRTPLVGGYLLLTWAKIPYVTRFRQILDAMRNGLGYASAPNGSMLVSMGFYVGIMFAGFGLLIAVNVSGFWRDWAGLGWMSLLDWWLLLPLLTWTLAELFGQLWKLLLLPVWGLHWLLARYIPKNSWIFLPLSLGLEAAFWAAGCYLSEMVRLELPANLAIFLLLPSSLLLLGWWLLLLFLWWKKPANRPAPDSLDEHLTR